MRYRLTVLAITCAALVGLVPGYRTPAPEWPEVLERLLLATLGTVALYQDATRTRREP